MRRTRLAIVCATLVGAIVADPAQATPRCERAISKALATCIQRVAKRSLACWSQDTSACPPDDPKRASAFASVDRTVRLACPDAAAVQVAGYPPLFTPTTLI